MVTRRKSKRRNLRFSVVVEFLVGLIGIYGVGRLLAGRYKEARVVLLISLVLYFLVDLTPRLVGNEYALWLPMAVRAVLAVVSAAQLNFVLDRA